MTLNQLYLFAIFFLNGIIIGLLFDFFRIWRKSFITSDFITYIQDGVFCVLIGIILLYSIFIFNNGEMRGFLFISSILGFSLYLLFISKYVIKSSVYIINKIKVFLKVLLKPLKYIKKCILKMISPITFLVINLKKYINSNIKAKKLSNSTKNEKKIKKSIKIRRILK